MGQLPSLTWCLSPPFGLPLHLPIFMNSLPPVTMGPASANKVTLETCILVMKLFCPSTMLYHWRACPPDKGVLNITGFSGVLRCVSRFTWTENLHYPKLFSCSVPCWWQYGVKSLWHDKGEGGGERGDRAGWDESQVYIPLRKPHYCWPDQK